MMGKFFFFSSPARADILEDHGSGAGRGSGLDEKARGS